MSDAVSDVAPGLRERKRIATRRAIQLAALRIVQERGLDAATVDEIARVADVSPRTFFNYFASKEEAVVGDGPTLPAAELQEVFVADRGPLFRSLTDIVRVSIDAALADHEVVVARRAVMKSHPEIAARRWASMTRFEQDLVALIGRRLGAETGSAPDAPDVADRARLAGLVAVAAMRHAWANWAEDDGEHASLVQRLEESFDRLGDLLATKAAR